MCLPVKSLTCSGEQLTRRGTISALSKFELPHGILITGLQSGGWRPFWCAWSLHWFTVNKFCSLEFWNLLPQIALTEHNSIPGDAGHTVTSADCREEAWSWVSVKSYPGGSTRWSCFHVFIESCFGDALSQSGDTWVGHTHAYWCGDDNQFYASELPSSQWESTLLWKAN